MTFLNNLSSSLHGKHRRMDDDVVNNNNTRDGAGLLGSPGRRGGRTSIFASASAAAEHDEDSSEFSTTSTDFYTVSPTKSLYEVNTPVGTKSRAHQSSSFKCTSAPSRNRYSDETELSLSKLISESMPSSTRQSGRRMSLFPPHAGDDNRDRGLDELDVSGHSRMSAASCSSSAVPKLQPPRGSKPDSPARYRRRNNRSNRGGTSTSNSSNSTTRPSARNSSSSSSNNRKPTLRAVPNLFGDASSSSFTESGHSLDDCELDDDDDQTNFGFEVVRVNRAVQAGCAPSSPRNNRSWSSPRSSNNMSKLRSARSLGGGTDPVTGTTGLNVSIHSAHGANTQMMPKMKPQSLHATSSRTSLSSSQHSTTKPLPPKLTQEQELEERKQRAYAWYTKMGMPSRRYLKRQIQTINNIDVSGDDIELLPWDESGNAVDKSKMNPEPSFGAASPHYSKQKSRPGPTAHYSTPAKPKPRVQLRKSKSGSKLTAGPDFGMDASEHSSSVVAVAPKKLQPSRAGSNYCAAKITKRTSPKILRKSRVANATKKADSTPSAPTRRASREDSRPSSSSIDRKNNSKSLSTSTHSCSGRLDDHTASTCSTTESLSSSSEESHLSSPKTPTAAGSKPPVRPQSCISEKERARRAYMWHSRMAQSPRIEMKRRVACTAGIDITPDDVDLLPWNAAGTRVDVAKVNRMLYR